MEFASDRIRVVLTRVNEFREDYRIRIFPTGRYMINTLGEVGTFYLNACDVKSEVDVISLTEQIVNSISSDKSKDFTSISPLFDTSQAVYSSFSSCIAQLNFKYEDLIEPGKLEKDLIIFDLYYNGYIQGITLLLIEAISLTRKAFKWKDVWAEFV